MATKYLNAVLGEEQALRTRAAKLLTAAYHAIDKQDLMAGRVGTYKPNDEENGEQLPDEYQRVQMTAREVWEQACKILEPLFDVTAARDFTNAGDSDAVADVVVDGEVLVQSAPAPYLIWLDRELDNLRNVAERMPTHPATSEWTLVDPERGIYVSEEQRTARQIQAFRSMVIAEATPQHKAQTHVWQDAIQAGWWTRRIYTGAMPVAEKAGLVARIVRLQIAVNAARQAANKVEAVEPKPGSKLLGYVFDAVSV